MENTLIYIAGTTAIGKTALSIQLAKRFNSSIISCDSRQFYKEMTIGTAVPSKEELAAAPHYFIQNRSIFDEYSVGDFERDALKQLKMLFVENPIQIMVGGSGLYANAVINGLDYFPDVAPEIRAQLNAELEENGLPSLQDTLKELDYESYRLIAIDNPHRLIRALEICIGTGKPYSYYLNKPKVPRHFNVVKIGLTADRAIIYDRINSRVDVMMQNGLLEEVKSLYPFKNLNALKTVGYKELFNFLDKVYNLNVAVAEIKKNTRRFAKRQLTWYRKDSEISWFDHNEDINCIIDTLKQQI